MRILLVVALMALCAVSGGSPARAGDTSAGMATSLDSLEKKYFQHTYEADLTDTRLERLEKMVFGEARSGSDGTRLANLVAISQSAQDDVPAPGSQPAGSASTAGQQAASSKNTTTTAQNTPDEDAVTPDSSDYPRVTALEQEILGQTYTNEPVYRRVGQLETHAFGSPSKSDDLGGRVDRLEQYAVAQLHVKPFGINPIMNDDPNNQVISYDSQPAHYPRSYRSQPPSVPAEPSGPGPQPGANAPMLAKVAWMEDMVFGHEFDDEHLLERLARLDSHFFPNDPHSSDKLMDETDQLMSAVALMPHDKSATQVASADGAGSSADQQSHRQNPLLRSVSQAFNTISKIAEDTASSGSISPQSYPMGYVPGLPSLPPGVGAWF